MLLSLASCSASRGFVSSLDDLTADVVVSGSSDLEQARSISLNGLAPSAPAGGMHRYTSGRTPFTAIGISSIKGDGGKGGTLSYVLRRTIDMNLGSFGKMSPEDELRKLVELRDALLGVRVEAAGLVKAIAEEVSAEASALEAEGSSRVASAESALRTASLGVESARRAFDDKYNAASRLLDCPGVVVVRVTSKEEQSIAGGLGSILGFSKEADLESTGFAVLGDLQFDQLYLGEDFGGLYSGVNRSWRLIGEEFPYILGFGELLGFPYVPIIGQVDYDNYWVTTASLKARYILYAQDQVSQERISTQLEASYKELTNLSETIGGAEKAKLQAVFEAVASLGNGGVLGDAHEEEILLKDVLPSRAKEPKDRGDGESKRKSGEYQTVYQVGTDYADLRRLMGGDGIRWGLGLVDLWNSLFG